jgi:hypothetical protein
MKRLFNIMICACVLALTACVNSPKVDNTDNAPSTEKGAVKLNVATRTTDGSVQRDYILSIFKKEADKQTLVRKYDSSKDDMQMPEYIWLLEGNYEAVVESGVAVAKTFNEEEKYFVGETSFDVKGGETAKVDVVATMQNIPVEVIFDQTIIDGFHKGYKVDVAADNEVLTYTESKKGYFIMPKGVTTLSWHFVGTFEYEDGEQVAIDKSGILENVAPKKAYKLSFKFSKDANGFLGGLDVMVDESIEERDDHLAFNPDPELRGVGFDLAVACDYAGGERKYMAKSPAEFKGVTLVAGDKEFNPVETPVAGIALEGLNTPELYVTLSEDFFYSLSGGSQIIELCVTDVSGGEARKELPYNLPGINGYDKSSTNLWRGTAVLSATVFGTPSSVNIAYRQGEGEWQSCAAQSSGNNIYTTQISGVSASSSYEYRLEIGGKVVGASQIFTTELGAQIPNGDLEDWCQDGNVIIPWANGTNPYWCTGNYGTTTLGASYNITKSSSDVRPGSKGTKSMYMDSEYIVMKFAAGNGYVGSWGGMEGLTNAKVYFGQPFEYNAKPKAIRFWAKWNCGTIDKTSGGVGKSGDPDICKIFCCMATNSHLVNSGNADGTTFSPSDANIKSGDARYNIVLYSAYFESTQSQAEWKQVEVPFTFYGSDPNQVPTHLILTFTCSGYGDFFDGSTESWMYVDDIELVY